MRNVADRERVAKVVIRLAHAQRSLDAAKIDRAIIEVRKESGTRRRRPFQERHPFDGPRARQGRARVVMGCRPKCAKAASVIRAVGAQLSCGSYPIERSGTSLR